MNRIRVSGIVLFDGKLVLVEHRKEGYKPYFLLPGGGIEQAESPEGALLREFKEETNLNVKVENLIFYKSVYTDNDYTLDLIFRCKLIGGELKNNDPDKKVIAIKLVSSSEELKQLNLHPKQLKKHDLFNLPEIQTASSLGSARYPEDFEEDENESRT